MIQIIDKNGNSEQQGSIQILPSIQPISGGGGSMVYPGAGIPLSTGIAWDTPITNNSTNWNTAFSWGDHSIAGYIIDISGQDLSTADNTTSAFITLADLPALGATTALDNLASVAINTSLISDTDNTDDLGSSGISWRTGYFGTSVIVPDEVYGAGWDGDLSVPTKNAIYDKIETLGGSGLTQQQIEGLI